ncbi:hypothetical protein [Brucella anthropi]|uniref:hypothetical protein n=1 Tax=Brucella anthropi TaxID=529 RepID=UPI000560EFD3|nr:hypothetical protein [Brucella anthropi]
MATCDLKISLNGDSLSEMLSALTEAANRFPEFGDSLLSFLNSGEELFTVDDDIRPAPTAGEFVVSFKPSDGLLDLISTFRASHPDCLVFKHDKPPADNSAQSERKFQ